MRCCFLVLFLVFPANAIAANAASDQSATIASLTREVEQLRAENERLSARFAALEKRFPSQQKMGVADFGTPPLGASPSVGGKEKQ